MGEKRSPMVGKTVTLVQSCSMLWRAKKYPVPWWFLRSGGMNGLFAKLAMTELRARQGVCSGKPVRIIFPLHFRTSLEGHNIPCLDVSISSENPEQPHAGIAFSFGFPSNLDECGSRSPENGRSSSFSRGGIVF